MDSLTYSYFTSGNDYYDGQSINRLQQVEEKAGTTAYTLDFEGTSAYTYDAIGNLTSDDGEEIATIEWNTYGKVRKVIREEDSEKPDLEFWYDPMGNRLCKIVKPRPSGSATNQDAWTFTWYIRDAQGNIMATYNETHDSNRNAYLTANEFPMYGSTRLGIQKAYDTISQILYTSSTFDNDGFYSVSYGSETITLPDTNHVPYHPLYKQYELSNHLGNVLATISARPRLIYDENDDFLYKDADLTSVSDYYPFGMLAPERHWQSDEYRFAFNGKEKIADWDGKMGTYDFDARLYNTLTGRWHSRDLKTAKYPNFSPYNFVLNNPIVAIDPDGKDIYIIIQNTNDKKPEIKKINSEQIISWLASSEMGEAMIQKYIKNPNEDVYIAFGNVPVDAEAITHRRWDDDGNIRNPQTIDIGENSYVDPQDILPDEFDYIQIDKNKKNYFVVLDDKEFGVEKIKSTLKAKRGAKVLGHEKGAHFKDKKQSRKDEEHVSWGQKVYGKFDAEPDSDASLFNNQVDKAIKRSDKYILNNGLRGKNKLIQK